MKTLYTVRTEYDIRTYARTKKMRLACTSANRRGRDDESIGLGWVRPDELDMQDV